MMLQLDPMIPLVTPKGNGYAFMVMDYSQEHHLLWVVAIDGSGEIWTFPNPEVRFRQNITMGRSDVSEISKSTK